MKGIDQIVKHLPCRHEDLSSIAPEYMGFCLVGCFLKQAWWLAILMLAVWVQRQVDPWGLLYCLLGKFQASKRLLLKNKLDSF